MLLGDYIIFRIEFRDLEGIFDFMQFFGGFWNGREEWIYVK